MANEENLTPVTQRTKNEAREISQKGGRASGRARKKIKSIREALQGILSGKYEVDGERVSGYEALALTAFKTAMEGNVQAFKEIRDTVGEKPSDKLNIESGEDSVKEIKISFVDKSSRKAAPEHDPQIVGEYTQGIDTDE